MFPGAVGCGCRVPALKGGLGTPRVLKDVERKLATDHKDGSRKALCELGGWKSPKTVTLCHTPIHSPKSSRPRRAARGLILLIGLVPCPGGWNMRHRGSRRARCFSEWRCGYPFGRINS